MDRILIVEDEIPIADSISHALKAEGYSVEAVYDGAEALRVFRASAPNLIILDLMLPILGGLDFCRIIRKESETPIIMLTARAEEIDRIIGLELGADDYMTKPFGMRELIARVRAILRRIETSQHEALRQSSISVGAIEMDVARRRVIVRGQPVHLPLKQFELLKTLMTNAGQPVSREDLVKYVWDSDASPDSGSLDVHIRWLREKIEEDPGYPRYLRTIRGIGYSIILAEESNN